jgi:hypothetical protein
MTSKEKWEKWARKKIADKNAARGVLLNTHLAALSAARKEVSSAKAEETSCFYSCQWWHETRTILCGGRATKERIRAETRHEYAEAVRRLEKAKDAAEEAYDRAYPAVQS